MWQHLFVSHAAEDLPWAEWIAWELKQAGCRATLQSRDFRPGANLVLELDRATREADGVLALLSPAYLKCPTKQPEWAAVFKTDPRGQEGKLIPVRVQPCLPEGLLAGLIAIDLVGLDEESARARLLEGLGARPRSDLPPLYPGTPERVEKPGFPGLRAPLGNIPHLPNPNFTGRGELLLKLREKLAAGRTAVLTQALSGLGGVGKTQLAVRYAYEHALEYRFTWWLRAEESAALASDFASLARYLGLPEKDLMDQRETIAAVRSWLEREPGWLLVFDNAEEPADLRPYIPRSGSGHVLITSRNPIWRGLSDSFVVTPFEPEESLDFLLRTTGQASAEVAASLADTLGHLPLALDQAASYIDATGISVAEYRVLFQKYSVRLLARGQPTTDYPATVATTWEISFDRLRRLSPAAEVLLAVFAFLGAEAIPRTLFQPGATGLPETLGVALADPLTLHDAILVLQRFSLLSVQPESYNIHRLVQAVIQDRLGVEGEIWLHAAASLLDAAFTFDHDDPATWAVSRKLLSHAVAVSNFRQFDLASAEAGHLFWRVGLYLSERADFADARIMLEESLKIHEKIHNQEHPMLARILGDLALVDQAMGKPREAKEALRRALSINTGQAVTAPEQEAALLGQMGLVELSLGQTDTARQLFEQALKTLQVGLRYESPGFAVGLGNLALAFHLLGESVTAMACQERALNLIRESLPPHHPTVAALESNLGLFLLDLGREEAAGELLEIATARDSANYGSKHPCIAIRMSNSALVAEARGEAETARRLLEAALAQDDAAFRGTLHPRIATTLNSLALSRQANGKLGEARQLLERALSELETIWDENHPGLAAVSLNLGSGCWYLEELEESREYLEKALLTAESALGKRHPLVVRILNNLGSVLAEQGDLESARSYLERGINVRKSGKARPLDKALLCANLAGVLESLGDMTKAKARCDDFLRLAVLAGSPGRVAATLARISKARLLDVSGQRADAVTLLEEAVRMEQAANPSNPLNLAFCLNNLASLYAADGRAERAQELLTWALLLCDHHGLSGQISGQIRQNLSALEMKSNGKQDEYLRAEPFQLGFHRSEGFIVTLAGVSPGGRTTGEMAAGNAAGLALVGPLLHTAACPSLQPCRIPVRELPHTESGIPHEADFETMVVRHASRIRQFFTRRGLSEAECEELTQDVFVELWRGMIRGPREITLKEISQRAWRRYHDHIRAFSVQKRGETTAQYDLWEEHFGLSSRQGDGTRYISFSLFTELAWREGWLYDESEYLTLDDILWSEEEDPLERLLDSEQKDLLQSAIKSLPTQMRMALELLVNRDLSIREIAEIMHLSIGTVKAYLHQARQRLRSLLGVYLTDIW